MQKRRFSILRYFPRVRYQGNEIFPPAALRGRSQIRNGVLGAFGEGITWIMTRYPGYPGQPACRSSRPISLVMVPAFGTAWSRPWPRSGAMSPAAAASSGC